MYFLSGRGRICALAMSAFFLVSACESSEERAQRHFETALELLEEGDVARAAVEFRNVFQLDPEHKEARLVFARSQLELGERASAYSHFLKVVESYPDTLEAQIELAEMAIDVQNWEEAERHGKAAIELDPENPKVEVIDIALAYAQAQRGEDNAVAAEQAERAMDILEEMPESMIAWRIVIDQKLRTGENLASLKLLNEALVIHPNDLALNATKLQLQLREGDFEAAGETLEQMADKFPENENIRNSLIAWYLKRGDVDNAETYLRKAADAEGATSTAKLTVVRFLLDTRGKDAARAELERLIATEAETITYETLLASMDFEEGNKAEAITKLETLLAEAEATQEALKAKVILAQMLLHDGNAVGARAAIEEVLLEDPSNVDGLKMRAAWLVDEDKPDDAIIDLRTALAQEPQDANILTLMAKAHERAGSRDLAGERYALAVEVSLQAVPESLRYATYLTQEGRVDAAKAVLDEALTKAPENVDLLRSMGALHVQTEDWNEATRMIWRLKALETTAALNAANGLEADKLLRQQRVDETIALLESLSAEGGNEGDAAFVALLRTKIAAQQTDEAVALLEERLASDPDNLKLQFMRAGLHMIQNERDLAEPIYVKVLEKAPGNTNALRTLNAIMIADGREAEAAALIDEQIAKAPNPTAAYLLKAERLEKEKDFEGAIAIYESLYAQNSANVVVANNLSSLITTHRDSAEDLDRAYAIARRLQNYEIPALQDTYGWIEYRRGNFDEAVKYLEPAAKGLPEHALVQYHLGMTYVALERFDEAKEVLTKAIEMAGEDPLPQFEKAREKLAELQGQ
ncbi:tetratricopeptide repeat protein [Roseovarius albus]|uniref:Tetratricopeptide repeat protein n=1 Tax=Roseovarius albus TaxID=1247867 RepID=A0A1X6YVF4_9RHOB|nr:tetratricopeptide repeat protein [Roseovarius albus]SLN32280.1 tetratricopeptide repeat protein [Roseovarius albus]